MLHQSSYPSEYPEREARRAGRRPPTLPGWLARTGGKSRLGSFFFDFQEFLKIDLEITLLQEALKPVLLYSANL